MARDSTDNPLCSFCGKPQDVVMQMIAGPQAYICDECIMLAAEMTGIQHPDWRARLIRVLSLLPDKT